MTVMRDLVLLGLVLLAAVAGAVLIFDVVGAALVSAAY